MANNRLWLVYRPTGKAVFLGKRMAQGWYGVPEDVKERIEAFFAHIYDNPETSQDDMMLAMEMCEGNSPLIVTAWRYTGFATSPLTTLEIEQTPNE